MYEQRDPGPLPNRWLRCPRKSGTLVADRFLAFKTPLSAAFKDKIPLDCLFPPDMLYRYCTATNIKIGLWIDLTNTKRFYDRKVVESFGCQYVKLQCRGHAETPSPEQTCSFIEIVQEFLNEHPLHAIGVHCTHGFNRTGFLIVAYMVERMDYSVDAALALFAAARPPGIYKQDYINELFQRYDCLEDALQAPELPDWCNDFDDSSHANVASGSSSVRSGMPMIRQHGKDDEAAASSCINGDGKRKKRKRDRIITNAKFMDGVSGVVIITDPSIVAPLQEKVQNMCGWKSNGFPGAQPVSMDMKNIIKLFQMTYRVSWKADGTRYMMLINKENEVYFFDRNFAFFQVNHLTFPKNENFKEHLENTLLDGEMVLDNDQGVIKPRYLVYDIVSFNGVNIGKSAFTVRSECILENIVRPRNKAITTGVLNKELESFGIHYKHFWTIDQTASLLNEKFSKSLMHKPDGLIYQPVYESYTAGQCNNVLKWKPHQLNSVDFQLKIEIDSGIGKIQNKVGFLYVGGKNGPYDKMKLTPAIANLNGKIIECSINHKGEWQFMRQRTDKSLPNSYDTAAAVVESIRNPVTEPFLLHTIELCKNAPKNDEIKAHGQMAPPPRPPPNHPRHMQQQQVRAQIQQPRQQQQQTTQLNYPQQAHKAPTHPQQLPIQHDIAEEDDEVDEEISQQKETKQQLQAGEDLANEMGVCMYYPERDSDTEDDFFVDTLNV